MNLVDHFFSHAGCINRRTYALSLGGLVWGIPLVAAIFPPAVLLLFPMVYAILCLTVKRLHDVGLSGKWAMLPLAAVFVQVAVLLVSGVIAFGSETPDAGSQAVEWAGAVGAAIAFAVFLSWVALAVMPGNRHSRVRFGRPPPPMIAPPVPDLKAMQASVREAVPQALQIARQFQGSSAALVTSASRVNYLKLLFQASGRTGRSAYIVTLSLALFICVLFIVNFVSMPLLNWLPVILFVYIATCLASKRLHDIGQSGWWAATPLILLYAFVVFLFCMSMISIGLFGQEARNHPVTSALNRSSNDIAGWTFLGTLLAYGVLGLIPGQHGENRHGPPPSAPSEDDDDMQPLAA